MTKLGEYLAKGEESQTAFAKKIGATPAMVSRYCSGDRIPSNRFAVAIAKATKDEIPVSYWARLEEKRDHVDASN